MYYIYKIENCINHKKYIGLTNNIARRRNRHFTDLKYNRHDNKFLQKEFNIYGIDNFIFSIEFSGDVTIEEIGYLEKEFIKKYDSYKNGYNQNEGGNFGPSNGGSQLTESDILNILACLEFKSRPGQVLADIYGITRTTISRIKKGINHIEVYEKYYNLSTEERKSIYKIFCDSTNFIEKKAHSTIIENKRQLSREQVYLILLNEELHRPKTIAWLVNQCKIKSSNTIYCILKGASYQDYYIDYQKIDKSEKDKLASLLSNQ